MHAVLPWQSASLDARYQEPNYSFGWHALTVSLWKPHGLDLTELCSNGYYGCPREEGLLTRVSSGSTNSIADTCSMGHVPIGACCPFLPTARRPACFLPRHKWTGLPQAGLVNKGQSVHTVTADDNSFDSGNLTVGAQFTHTFTQPGRYPYYCQMHGGAGGFGMAGVIIVDSSSNGHIYYGILIVPKGRGFQWRRSVYDIA